MTLINLVKKSKVLQITILSIIFAIFSAIAFMITKWAFFLVICFVVLGALLFILFARVVELQWNVATLDKSTNRRRREIEEQIALLGLTLRQELHNENRRNRTRRFGQFQSAATKSVQPMGFPSTTAPLVGRLAAGVPDSGERSMKLHEMLNQLLPNASKTQLLGVSSPALTNMLSREYEVHELLPGIIHEQIHASSARVLVIDQEAFRRGPWYGADAAAGTLLFTELSEAVEMARNADMAVWYVSTGGVPNPYTNELRDSATGIFGFNEQDNTWAEDIGIVLKDIIDIYVAGVRVKVE